MMETMAAPSPVATAGTGSGTSIGGDSYCGGLCGVTGRSETLNNSWAPESIHWQMQLCGRRRGPHVSPTGEPHWQFNNVGLRAGVWVANGPFDPVVLGRVGGVGVGGCGWSGVGGRMGDPRGNGVQTVRFKLLEYNTGLLVRVFVCSFVLFVSLFFVCCFGCYY